MVPKDKSRLHVAQINRANLMPTPGICFLPRFYYHIYGFDTRKDRDKPFVNLTKRQKRNKNGSNWNLSEPFYVHFVFYIYRRHIPRSNLVFFLLSNQLCLTDADRFRSLSGGSVFFAGLADEVPFKVLQHIV